MVKSEMLSAGLSFERLVPSWWHCFRRLYNLWEVETSWRKKGIGIKSLDISLPMSLPTSW